MSFESSAHERAWLKKQSVGTVNEEPYPYWESAPAGTSPPAKKANSRNRKTDKRYTSPEPSDPAGTWVQRERYGAKHRSSPVPDVTHNVSHWNKPPNQWSSEYALNRAIVQLKDVRDQFPNLLGNNAIAKTNLTPSQPEWENNNNNKTPSSSPVKETGINNSVNTSQISKKPTPTTSKYTLLDDLGKEYAKRNLTDSKEHKTQIKLTKPAHEQQPSQLKLRPCKSWVLPVQNKFEVLCEAEDKISPEKVGVNETEGALPLVQTEGLLPTVEDKVSDADKATSEGEAESIASAEELEEDHITEVSTSLAPDVVADSEGNKDPPNDLIHSIPEAPLQKNKWELLKSIKESARTLLQNKLYNELAHDINDARKSLKDLLQREDGAEEVKPLPEQQDTNMQQTMQSLKEEIETTRALNANLTKLISTALAQNEELEKSIEASKREKPALPAPQILLEQILQRLTQLEEKCGNNFAPPPINKTFKEKPQKTIVIRPKGNNTVKDIKNKITSIENNTINGITKIVNANTAVVITAETTEVASATHKFLTDLKDDNFEIIKGYQRKRKLIIYNVNKKEKPESSDFQEKLKTTLNFEHKDSIRIIRNFPSSTNSEAVHVIISVPITSAAALAKSGSLYMGFKRHHVRRYVEAQCCSNCFSYHHATKNCSNLSWCGYCSGQHPTTTCQKTPGEARCLHCNVDHPTYSKSCPINKKFLKEALIKQNTPQN